MSQPPLMPKATAVWLVENTALTFQQIADFCQLHELEVKGIADGDVAQGIKGLDPIAGGQLAREELEKAEADIQTEDEMPAERKAEILAKVRAKIAELARAADPSSARTGASTVLPRTPRMIPALSKSLATRA